MNYSRPLFTHEYWDVNYNSCPLFMQWTEREEEEGELTWHDGGLVLKDDVWSVVATVELVAGWWLG
jgi:hypothetical protein